MRGAQRRSSRPASIRPRPARPRELPKIAEKADDLEAPLVDSIMSENCPVSRSLTDADKANLRRIKQDAIKKAGR